MSFILQDFEVWLTDNDFVSAHCRSTAIEFGNFINKSGGLAEENNGFGFTYNKHEINALHEQVIRNADYPNDGNGNLIPDDEMDVSADHADWVYDNRKMEGL